MWCTTTVKQSLLCLTIVVLFLARLWIASDFLRVTANDNTFRNNTTKWNACRTWWSFKIISVEHRKCLLSAVVAVLTEQVFYLSARFWEKLCADPEIPTHCLRQSIKIVWSAVSKAALRSKRIKTEQSPTSAVKRRSFVTLIGDISSALRCKRKTHKNSGENILLKTKLSEGQVIKIMITYNEVTFAGF